MRDFVGYLVRSLDAWDCLALAGILLAAIGLGLLWAPAAPIFCGAALIVVSLLGARPPGPLLKPKDTDDGPARIIPAGPPD